MDQTQLQENIALYYSKLPPKAQEVFSSMNWLKSLEEVSTKYGLQENQVQTLGTETTLVLLGIIDLGEYEDMLRKEIALPPQNLEKMVAEINQTVVNTIRPELVSAFQNNNQVSEGDQLDERFAKLPANIQQAVRRSNYHKTLDAIASEFKLTVPQMIDLENATTNTLLGITNAGGFASSVKSLGLPEDKTKLLVAAVTLRILEEIRKEMVVGGGSPQKNEGVPIKINVIKPVIAPAESAVSESQGIDIVPEKLELTGKVIPPFVEKLSAPVKVPVAKTEHSLENITKNSMTMPMKPSSLPGTQKAYPKGGDPYRMIPE